MSSATVITALRVNSSNIHYSQHQIFYLKYIFLCACHHTNHSNFNEQGLFYFNPIN